MDYLNSLIELVEPIPVRDVVVGIFDTVVVSDMAAGLASTLRDNYPGPHGGISNGGRLTSLSLRELAKLAVSDNLIEASVGMAAINSFFNSPKRGFQVMNGIDLIKAVAIGRSLAFIGHFPFVNMFSDVADRLAVFERQPMDGDIPSSEIPSELPKFDVVVITSTTLTNHTFGEVISHSSPNAFKILLGPSTPLSPVLFDYGVDALCGTVVVDTELAVRHVKEAVPFHDFNGIEHVTFLRDGLNWHDR